MAIVAFQVVMPLKVLISDPGKKRDDEYLYRYGWEMFTRTEIDVRYETVSSTGQRRSVNAEADLDRPWGNVHYGSYSPDRICAREAGATLVIRRMRPRTKSPPSTESFSCR